VGIFDGLIKGDRKVRPARDRLAVRDAALVHAQARAASAVFSSAEDAARALPEPRRAIALALVRKGRALMADGNGGGAAQALFSALGKAWARRLRTATAARRVVHRRKNGDAPPVVVKPGKRPAADRG